VQDVFDVAFGDGQKIAAVGAEDQRANCCHCAHGRKGRNKI
jgi:hypothetical protein